MGSNERRGIVFVGGNNDSAYNLGLGLGSKNSLTYPPHRKSAFNHQMKTFLERHLPLPSAVNDLILEFLSWTQCRNYVDMQDSCKRWFLAVILDETCNEICLGYIGWARNWNEWLDLNNKLVLHERLAPRGTYTDGEFDINDERRWICSNPTSTIRPSFEGQGWCQINRKCFLSCTRCQQFRTTDVQWINIWETRNFV